MWKHCLKIEKLYIYAKYFLSTYDQILLHIMKFQYTRCSHIMCIVMLINIPNCMSAQFLYLYILYMDGVVWFNAFIGYSPLWHRYKYVCFSYEGPGSCQQLHISQIEAGSPEAAPVLIDVDLISTPSKAGRAKDNLDVLVNQDKSPMKVDLRSEAKMAAEVRSISIGEICCMLLCWTADVFLFRLYYLLSLGLFFLEHVGELRIISLEVLWLRVATL